MLKPSKKYTLFIFLLILSSYVLFDYDAWYSFMVPKVPDPPKYDPNFRCKIFQLDRHAYMELPVQESVKICDYAALAFVSAKDMDHIALNADDPKFKCCYSPLLPSQESWSKLYLSNHCIEVGKTNTKVHHPFLQITCKGSRSERTQLLSMVPPISKDQKNTSAGPDMNVIVFLFDGVSRRSFNVHLPLTRTELSKIKAIEFIKQMRVAETAFGNFMALTTGLTEDENFVCWDKNMRINDNCPFIWESFAGRGYVTAFLEDSFDSRYFDFEGKGFSKPPYDYYLKPFNLYMKKFKYHLPNKKQNACVGNKFIFTNFIEYTKKYLQRMKTLKNKHFTIMHTSLVKNESTLSSLDRNFYDFFQFLTKEDLIRNTLIFLSSNQGGDYRKTINFESPEINLPFMYVYLPPLFKNNFPQAQKNFLENSKRLTTVFDVHETLKMIFHRNINRKYDYARSLSLFSEIPKGRSCVDAGVPDEFCACSQTIMEKMDGSQIHNIATIVLSHINSELGTKHKLCAKLEMDKIIKGTKVHVDKLVYDIKVRFSTKPGTGIFEAVILDEGYRYNVKEVYRRNPYKHESCIVDEDLERFCYCPEHKSEL